MINTVVGVLQGRGGVEAISGQRMEWVRFKRFPGISSPRAKSENEHCTLQTVPLEKVVKAELHWIETSGTTCGKT